MKTNELLSKILLTFLFFFCISGIYGQDCEKFFWSAKEQYKSGQFESAQKLLDNCINSLNSNSDEVFKVYKLYIAACIENKDKACADAKTQKLIDLFGDEDKVHEMLDQTDF
ncbi:MAG: hypothetical protein WA913_16995 [Pricia sp.]